MKARSCCVSALATGLTCFSSLVAAEAIADDGLCGKAAWFDAGGLTASGELNEANARSAAHQSLPFGTRVEVDNLDNGRSAVVRINDRGSFAKGRVILVSRAAAEELGMIDKGTAEVRLTVLGDDGRRRGHCGEADKVAQEEPADPKPPIADTPVDIVALEPTVGVGIVYAEPVEQGSAPSAPDLVEEDAIADEPHAARFEIAFRAKSWWEAEYEKIVGDFGIAEPTDGSRGGAVTRAVKRNPTHIGLSPPLIPYLWSTEVSVPHLARFAHEPVRDRLLYLTLTQ